MARCEDCGTIHGTKSYREDGEKVTYCVDCAPKEIEEVDKAQPVVEYPDQR